MKKRLYVYVQTIRTDRGTVWVLRTNENKIVRVSRKRFNQLVDEHRVYGVSDYENK